MNLSTREGPNDGHAPGSEADKERLCAWIDAHRHEMVAFLQELIRIPADNPPGDCQRIADWLYRHLQAFPLDDVQLLPVPQERVESVGMVRVANVVARMAFGDGSGPVVGLNAHGDAVAPGLGWTRNPYGGDVVEGAVYGRGAAVSKSDIAVYTYAAAALHIVTAPLSGQVDLVFTFDEEAGGTIGPARLLAEGTIRPDVAITAGFTHSIVNAHGGCLHLEVRLQGRSAHAAEPELGVDALEAMTQVLHELYQYRDRLAERRSKIPGLGSPTLVVGLIRGGINTNVVPDECVIRLDRRLIPEEDGDQVENEIRRLIEEAVSSRPVRVDIQRILYAKPLRPTPPESRFIQTLKKNWTTVMGGREPDIHGVPLYTDARHFAEAGIPVVLFGAGPRTVAEAGGHRADEHVRIDDMVLAAKILTMTLYDLLRKGVGGNER